MSTDHQYTPRREPRDPAAAYLSFVEELAADPDHPALLDRLTLGHTPDRDGWCASPGHAPHWERHPCGAVRLAMLVARSSQTPSDRALAQRAMHRPRRPIHDTGDRPRTS
jgi:hypothetical protein